MTRKLHFWDLFTFFESESQYMFKKKKKKNLLKIMLTVYITTVRD